MRTMLKLAAFAVMGMGAYAYVHRPSILGALQELKSPQQLAREIDSDLQEQSRGVLEAAVVARQLETELSTQKSRRAAIGREMADVQRQMTFIRDCLKQPGEAITVVGDIRVARVDVQGDLRTVRLRFAELETESQALAGSIREIEASLASAKSDISSARQVVAKDHTWLRSREMDIERKKIRDLTARRNADAAPFDALAAGAIRVDEKKRLLERKLALPVAEIQVTHPWELWSKGFASSDDALIDEVDQLLTKLPPQTRIVGQ